MEKAGDKGKLRKKERRGVGRFSTNRYFQGVIDGLTDDLKIVDAAYRVVYVNRTAAQKLFKEPSQILGRKCYEVFNHFDRPCPFCTTQKTFETGETLHTEFGYTDTEGDPYFFLLTTFPLRDPDGKIPYVVEVTRDVTQEKRLEQEIVRSRTLKAIGQFAAELAHEVRNPLNAISFQMALLKKIKNTCVDEECGDRISEVLEIVHEEIGRLTKITQDFLTFTRHESLQLVRADLREAVRSTLNFLREYVKEKQLEIVADFCDEPVFVLIDRDRFRQVLLNLAKNTVEAFTGKGTITISVRVGREGEGILRVADDGPGIPHALSKKVFDPFFSSNPRGTGLGLSIVKNIVEAHGGTITLEPSLRGAVFKIVLPGISKNGR